eukprot:366327-Lingulodinium_polyedra.AAC.1
MGGPRMPGPHTATPGPFGIHGANRVCRQTRRATRRRARLRAAWGARNTSARHNARSHRWRCVCPHATHREIRALAPLM